MKNLFRTKSPEQVIAMAEESSLRRKLTCWDLAAIGIGSVVGTGIFVATGEAALKAGPAVVISFLVAGVTCGLCALTFAELATMFPAAGSTYTYSYVAFGELIAWIIGWDLILEYLVAASAVASGWSATFVSLLRTAGIDVPAAIAVSPLSPGGVIDLPAVFISMVITYILYLGIKASAGTNNLIVGVKIAIILLFLGLGSSHIDFQNFKPYNPFGWHGIMSGAAIIFFAYVGFDALSTGAEESKNPRKDVPLALIICLGVVTFLYVAVGFVLTGVVKYDQIDQTGNALPAALTRIGIHWGGALVATGAILGMVSTLLVTAYGQVRIFMAMSRDGLLPRVFCRIHPQHKTPHVVTWITGILTAVLSGFLPLPALMELVNIGTLFAFVLVSIGVIVLRVTRPNFERKFRIPGAPFTPCLTIAFSIYLMAYLPIVTWLRFFIWIVIGFLIYFLYSRKHSLLQRNFAEKSGPPR